MSINISRRVAHYIVRECCALFYEGTGIVLAPLDELQHRDAGFIDELNPDPESDIRYWANRLMFFIRTVHGMVNQALLEQEEENDQEI